MSTKAIRAALAELKRHATTDCGTEEAAAKVSRKHDAAMKEVAAIEASAKAIAALGGLPAYKTGLSRAEEIGIGQQMIEIAKDAP